MKKTVRKLTLSKETVRSLEQAQLKEAHGMTGGYSCVISCVAECQVTDNSDFISCGFC